MNESNSIIIAVDHGYGNIKTVNTVFPSNIIPCDAEPAFAQDKLYWAGRWYAISDGHKEFIDNKTQDDDYLLLTMAAIAKELALMNLTEAQVHLAVGLPLTWFGQQSESFVRYLLRVPVLDYTFNGVDYHVELTGAYVFPQGLAAVSGRMRSFTGTNMLCDIGNGTMSSMFIINGNPQQDRMFMEKYGTYQCTLAVREALMKKLHLSVHDSEIEQVLRTGCSDSLSERVLETIHEAAKVYVEGIMRSLREHGYNEETTKLYLMGGGAVLVKNFGEYDSNTVTFNEDIHATAKGYQALAEFKRKNGASR